MWVFRWLARAIALIVGAVVLYVAFWMVYPPVWWLKEHNPRSSAFMRQCEREWRREGIDREIRREWVSLDRISSHVTSAVVISEDDKFWDHHGFDTEAIRKAYERNKKAGYFRYGASTITQQLVKNLYLSPSRNPLRKITEAIITWRIERVLDKRRILELYLNVAEWGNGIYGIEAAARHHFGVSAAGLSANQAARLAAILPNPRKLRPDGSSAYINRRAAQIQAIMARRSGGASPDEAVLDDPPLDLLTGDELGDDLPVEGEAVSPTEAGESGVAPSEEPLPDGDATEAQPSDEYTGDQPVDGTGEANTQP